MNIVNVEHIHKIFGEKVIFDDASFGIHEGDKIGVIGINGTGKTTLLKMIADLEAPDQGQIIRQNGLKIAYLPQDPQFPKGATLQSYIQDSEMEWKVQSNLQQLGITDLEIPIAHLSGGQKRKAALAKILAGGFDLLILDEPTNHLDEAMILWLEEYLRNFKGTLLMVTHDRYFLDQVTNKIVEVSRGKMYTYAANYSRFLELKAERADMELASERKRQSLLRIELEWAKRGCRARSTKQRARLERLEDLKNTAAPIQETRAEMDSIETRMGKKTIEVKHLYKSYGEQKILEDFSYIFLKNQKVGVIGPNGCGKSTIMKMLAGVLEPDSGAIEVGETIRIGYFAQEDQGLEGQQRVIDYVKDIGEYVMTKEGRISASQLLERFLFTPDMQFSPIGKLSGGEKRRLSLLGILVQNVNVLILDECSDSLDIPTLAVLEEYLNLFSGIVITVSHDRYFLDNVADRILELDGKGHIHQYEGGYTDYLEAKGQRHAAPEEAQKKEQKKVKNTKDWKQNRPVKLKFTYNEQREFETIEEDIAKLEQQIEDLEQEMIKNATNSVKLQEMSLQKEKAETELEEKMERWVYLNDLAERIEKQNQA